MKRFRFRLQKYLDLKRQEEGLQRIYLAEAQQSYQKQLEIMESIRRKFHSALEQMRQSLIGEVDPIFIGIIGCFLEYQKAQEIQQEAVLKEARAELERRQLEVLKVQKERKLLERLYTRRWQAYYQEFLREEQRNIDEVGLISFFRKQEEPFQ
ncbi:MAG: flagellar export protein FliJ [Thermacetogeniaceae bacterium]